MPRKQNDLLTVVGALCFIVSGNHDIRYFSEIETPVVLYKVVGGFVISFYFDFIIVPDLCNLCLLDMNSTIIHPFFSSHHFPPLSFSVGTER